MRGETGCGNEARRLRDPLSVETDVVIKELQ
jgi:hypothetical protein